MRPQAPGAPAGLRNREMNAAGTKARARRESAGDFRGRGGGASNRVGPLAGGRLTMYGEGNLKESKRHLRIGSLGDGDVPRALNIIDPLGLPLPVAHGTRLAG